MDGFRRLRNSEMFGWNAILRLFSQDINQVLKISLKAKNNSDNINIQNKRIFIPTKKRDNQVERKEVFLCIFYGW